jgi:ABC-type antimicrobial peptide transport system permease subunit
MLQVGRAGFGASVLGVVVGLAVCVAALRVMRSAVFGVGVYDASTLSAVVSTLVVVALMASILPALKIAKIDPAKTLRDE